MNRVFKVECHGGPREMGRQYGEQAREGIVANLEKYAQLKDPAAARRSAAVIRRLLAERLPEVLAEIEGMAEGSKTDPDRLLLFNHVDSGGQIIHDQGHPEQSYQ